MVSRANTTPEAEREAKFRAALDALKAAAMEYDPSILGMGIVHGGNDLDRLDFIMFSRDEKFCNQFENTEGGAA